MGKKGANKHNDFIYLRGKGIKYAVLIDKNEKLKIIPYNFDYVTFLLGGISYLIRKEFLKGISLILVQALLIYILNIPIGLILNYVITFILAIFSGKDYVRSLINNGAIEFNSYEENGYSLEYNEGKEITALQEKRGRRKKRSITENIKMQNLIFYITSVAIIALGTIVTGMNLNGDIENKYKGVYANKENNIINFTVLLTDKDSLHSFSIVEVNKLENNIKANYYVGDLLVKDGEKSFSVNELYKKDGILKNSVIEENFNVENSTQLKLNLNDYKKFMDYNEKDNLEKIYNNILLKSIELEYKKFDEFINSISLLENNEDKNLVNEKYLESSLIEEYKKIINKDTFKLTKGEYKEKRLSDIVSTKAILALNGELKDKIVYYMDEEILDLNDTIKKLKGKDEELKKLEFKQEQEEIETYMNGDFSSQNINSGIEGNSSAGITTTKPSRPQNTQGSGSSGSGTTGGTGGVQGGTSGGNQSGKPNRPQGSKPDNNQAGNGVEEDNSSGSQGGTPEGDNSTNSGGNEDNNNKPPLDGDNTSGEENNN